ncbi:MAG: hypothetical protein L6R42_007577 [Xanthoria sp. 1 TBL-2021]|nr:MAG: hypothetical protein L6R42_007577 [Xanthoria sp. 1 TBL-2021]
MSGYEASIVTELNFPNKTTIEVTDASDVYGLLYENEYGWTDYRNRYHFYDSTLNASYQNFINDPNHEATPKFYTGDSKNYNCIAEKGVYSWGFSGEWVLIVPYINSVWILGSYILWLNTKFNSDFTRKGRRMGTYRAIADVAEAIREDLGEYISASSEQDQGTALKRRGPVKYYVDEIDERKMAHIGLSS